MVRNNKQSGQSYVELTLIFGLVALVVIGALRILGLNTSDLYCQVVVGLGGQTETCPGEGVIFWDDFSDDLSNWEFDRGNNWQEEEDELCAGRGEHRAYAANTNAEDYTITLNATLKSGSGYGIFFRANESEVNGYTFQYDRGYGAPGAFIFRKWINGREMSPFRPWQAAPPDFEWYDVARTIVVQVRGNTFTASVDGQVVATAVDEAAPPEPYFTDGRIGIRTWNSEVCFHSIQVTVP